ncbi:Serine/threonine protein kinase domain protein [Candidatus Magnetoovum chiemensis]|nr:Serine/threonine protein kinase domain protein [Candidatus Magnetoovum chiemensis]
MNEDSDKTIVEDDRTIVENDKTLVEDDRTIIEKPLLEKTQKPAHVQINTFKDYQIIKEFPATGGEADIFLVSKENETYILKLYRRGMIPGSGILEKAKTLSSSFPDHIVNIYEYGCDDNNTGRWFEIQEYAAYGSLREYIKQEGREKPSKDRIKEIVTEISEALKVIHSSGILHLDLKPSNILVRETDPINLIFTDFGISSMLDPELSRKRTVVKGTPLYWSPEAFTGVVGKETDWWGLGVIVLELLLGRHPFSGLDERIIMYTLSTKGIDIPDDIDDDYALLLRGLFTRQPKKRWGYEQVSRWLKGDNSIPEFYSNDENKTAGYNKTTPFLSGDKQYYTMEDLAESFIENEDSWEGAQIYVKRAYISRWLSKNDNYGLSIRVEKLIERTQYDPELSLITIIYTFNKTLPFVVFGKYVTAKNLFIYAGKVINKSNTSGEGKLIDALLCGKLLDYYKEYLRLTEKPEDELLSTLQTLSKAFSGNKSYENKMNHILALDVLLDPDSYIIPIELKNILYNDVEYISANHDLLFTRAEYAKLNGAYVIPTEIKRCLIAKSTEVYLKGARVLRKLIANELLLTVEEASDIIDNTIAPQEIKDNIKTGSTPKYVCAVKFIRKALEFDRLLRKDAFEALDRDFVIPFEIKEGLSSNSSIENFLKANDLLFELKTKDLLLREKDILNEAKSKPQSLVYLDSKEDTAFDGKNYPYPARITIGQNWIKRFKTKSKYTDDYIKLSKRIKTAADSSLLPLLDRLEEELKISIDYLEPYKSFSSLDQFSEYNIFLKFSHYAKGLKLGIIRWHSKDKEILSALQQKLDAVWRSLERKVEKKAIVGLFSGLAQEAVKALFDKTSFSKACMDIYIKHQQRIDEVVFAYTDELEKKKKEEERKNE